MKMIPWISAVFARMALALMALTLIALTFMAFATPSAASPETELLFATPHFEAAPEDGVLRYVRRQVKKAPEGEGMLNESVEIELMLGSGPDGRRWSEVVIDPAGAARRYDRFEGLSGNPMLMVFLEDVVNAVREGTGGSPFYLRNRMKEALAGGIEREDVNETLTLLTLRPFEGDERQAELGPFSDLTLSFEMNRAAPGMFASMRAIAEPAYREEITLVPSP